MVRYISMDSSAVRRKDRHAVCLMLKKHSSRAGPPPAESTKATGTAARTSAGEIPAALADPRAGECCWAVQGTWGRLSPTPTELKITLHHPSASLGAECCWVNTEELQSSSAVRGATRHGAPSSLALLLPTLSLAPGAQSLHLGQAARRGACSFTASTQPGNISSHVFRGEKRSLGVTAAGSATALELIAIPGTLLQVK